MANIKLKEMIEEIEDEVLIHVDYSIGSNCWKSSDDGASFVTEIKGKVYTTDDAGRKGLCVGILSAIILHVKSALEEDADIEELLDGHSFETSGYTRDFFDFEEQELKKPFNKDENGYEYDVMDRDILIIKHICLNKEGRGFGIGLKVLKDIEVIFGLSKLIIMRPYPLQFSEHSEFKEMDMDGLSKSNQKTATEKLTKRYESVGYRKSKQGLVFKSL